MSSATLTISRRINAGFILLIVLCTSLGLFATYHMRTAATGATFLAGAVVPQASVADELSVASLDTQLAVRTFGLTGDPAQLELANQHLAAVATALESARKLAAAHPELTALRDGVKAADDALDTYRSGFEATRDNVAELARVRQQLDTAAAAFVKNISDYIAGQDKKLAAEIAAGLAAEKLEERRLKLALANHLIDAGNAIRIANFKAQALRDAQVVEKALPLFDEIERQRQALLKITVQESDLRDLADVQKSADTYRTGIDAIVRNSARGQDLAARRGKAADEFDAVVNGVLKRSIERTLDYSRATADGLSTSSSAVVTGVVLTGVLGLAIGFLIVRNINRVLTITSQSLSQGSVQVAAASNQVSSASQSLAEGSSEQAASLEEISSSLEELSSTTKHNAENAGSAKTSADEARTAAEQGAAEMERMQQAMAAIRQSSSDISKILKTIDEIAFQTNILALNAAVEAARAGEAGAGFAVVADEVRNLAQRCAVAARETADKISEATTRSEQGVELSNQVGSCLTRILEKAREVDALVADVSTASSEQSRGIDQINLAVGELDKVTQSNAANAEETASAAEELSAQSTELRFAAAQLATLVGLATDDTRDLSRPAPAAVNAPATPRSPSASRARQPAGRRLTPKPPAHKPEVELSFN